jgi:hypothetical protein
MIHVAPSTDDASADRAHFQAAFDAAYPGCTVQFTPERTVECAR